MIEHRAKATVTMAMKCLTKAAKFHQKLESIHVQKMMQWPPPRTTTTKYPDFHYCYEGENNVQKGASAVARRREAEPRNKHHLIAHRLPTEVSEYVSV